MTSRERGFTLLEVMVALSLLATLAVAIYSASGHLVNSTSAMAERQLAMWIADNHLNELRAGMRRPEAGQHSEPILFAKRHWDLMTLTRRAPHPGLLRVEIQVRSANQGQLRASLAGFIEVGQ